MSRHLTSDEVRQHYIATMGDELGSQFNRLYNECAWLHLEWSEYVALFGVSQSRMDILNASARGFFVLLDSSLWSDLLLHLCTLTDDPEVGRRKRQTVTVRRLPALVNPAIREKEKVKRLVSAAVKKSDFARDWRGRHIVHRDLNLALKPGCEAARPRAGNAWRTRSTLSRRFSARWRTTTARRPPPTSTSRISATQWRCCTCSGSASRLGTSGSVD